MAFPRYAGAGQYVTVLASGLGRQRGYKKKLFAYRFKLSASGDVLPFSTLTGCCRTKYILPSLPYGVSMGRADGQDSLFI